MKKFVFILGLVLMFIFSGCGSDDAEEAAVSNSESNEEAPSAVGPDSLPNMTGPLKPPSR